MRADPGGLETVVETAAASSPAVRLNPPKSTTTVKGGATTTTKPPAAPPTDYFFPLEPVVGCVMLHQFGAPRSGHTHQGEDIAAPLGTKVLAVVDGTLNRQILDGSAGASLSGNAWYLTDANSKAYFFYAHLSGFAPGLTVGSQVKQGDVIGYVGDTGNPAPGSYHLHFEIHPTGTSAYVIDPGTVLSVPPPCKP